MLKNIKAIRQFFIKSIGFYPAVISLLFLITAIIMLNNEFKGLSRYLFNQIPIIIITDFETARTAINIIISGIISITVFSFTMVMVVLNQASTNYSPRLLPGIVTNRSHQIILGFYLGTIIYTLMILINLESDDFKKIVPGASILLAVLFTIVSLGLFVYFIHSIFQTIQIGNIMENVFSDTQKEMENEIKNQQNYQYNNLPQFKEWFPIRSTKSGFIESINGEQIARLAKENDFIIKTETIPGTFILKETPFVMISKKITDDRKICEEILKNIVIKQEEIVALNYLYGFKQLSEIAVKALSPGINDPGTASRAINYLTELFALFLQISENKVVNDKSGEPRIILKQIGVKELLEQNLSPIRNYGKKDVNIIKDLFKSMYNLIVINYNNGITHFQILKNFTNSIIEDAEKSINNSLDRESINEVILKINKDVKSNYKFPYLKTTIQNIE